MLAKWSAALLERPNTPEWFVLIDCHVCNFLPMFREEWPVEQMWFSTNSWAAPTAGRWAHFTPTWGQLDRGLQDI